eukprot:1337198-Prorocentrum_lima.AAC.1
MLGQIVKEGSLSSFDGNQFLYNIKGNTKLFVWKSRGDGANNATMDFNERSRGSSYGHHE